MKKEFPRVLIGTPIYSGKEYCRERFYENVKRLTYPNATFTFVDNSKGTSYLKKLRKSGCPAVQVPRGKNSRDALQNASNYLRKRVIDGGYEYLMFLESDLFPEPDIIERLLECMEDVDNPVLQRGRRVIGAPYFIGQGGKKKLCIFEVNKVPDGRLGTRPLNPGDENWFLNSGLRRVHGMGVGCTLIHKSIIKNYPFWYSLLDDDRMRDLPIKKHPDVYFYLDLHNDGVPVYCNTHCYTIHEPSDWSKVKDV